MTHKQISYIKSWIRIISFLILPYSIIFGSIGLIIAEIGGILEEWNEN